MSANSNRKAYKAVAIPNSKAAGVEPRAWLDDAYFSIDLFPTRKANMRLAKFICEKMNRAFKTGRRVERDGGKGRT